MANQGQQGNQRQRGQGDRDRKSNLGRPGSDTDRPTGTSGQHSEPRKQPDRGNQQNEDEEDSGIGNRNTNR
jgi:hypothetical protein